MSLKGLSYLRKAHILLLKHLLNNFSFVVYCFVFFTINETQLQSQMTLTSCIDMRKDS